MLYNLCSWVFLFKLKGIIWLSRKAPNYDEEIDLKHWSQVWTLVQNKPRTHRNMKGTKNVTFKEAINIWIISHVITRKYYLKLTTNVHMNKKKTFSNMCKKVSMRRTTIISTTHQGCKINTKLLSLGHSLFGHLTTWQGKLPSTRKAFSLGSRLMLQQEVKK